MENQLFFSFNHFLLKSLGYRTAQPTKQSKDCQIDQFDKKKIAKEPLMSTKTITKAAVDGNKTMPNLRRMQKAIHNS